MSHSKEDLTSETLLDAARTVFMDQGLKALSVRKVAEAAGLTTMAVYSRFGSKEGILKALFDEGFETLYQAQQQVLEAHQNSTAVERVWELCKAYQGIAANYPHHYALMLGLQQNLTPDPQSTVQAKQTLTVLQNTVLECLDTSKPQQSHSKRQQQALQKALQIFAFCHGWCSLQLSGFALPAQEDSFRTAILALLNGDSEPLNRVQK
jgi:AcrR family transcriptional regulator